MSAWLLNLLGLIAQVVIIAVMFVLRIWEGKKYKAMNNRMGADERRSDYQDQRMDSNWSSFMDLRSRVERLEIGGKS